VTVTCLSEAGEVVRIPRQLPFLHRHRCQPIMGESLLDHDPAGGDIDDPCPLFRAVPLPGHHQALYWWLMHAGTYHPHVPRVTLRRPAPIRLALPHATHTRTLPNIRSIL
jgi:hypothetical protein